ncbi:DDE-type integrase/transposase/recombinase [Streptomyces vinaceus]|uniref:DDE-type integrase/transposase/recombinase n=1 Tax=Streptomyces vinaceus TaxID=1960 RepID=UPI00381332BF
MNRCQFVADHQRRHGVKRLPAILGIARPSFYYWRATAVDRAARQSADARLATRMQVVHHESDDTKCDQGEWINLKRVARIMRQAGLAGLRLRHRHRTTVPDPAAAKAPDLIGHDSTAREVNTEHVGDITYLPSTAGSSATSQPSSTSPHAAWPAGRFRLAVHMRTELVIDVLAAAQRTRGSLAGAVIHTDHGSQYASRVVAEACRSAGVIQSMGAIGSSADNALAEPFNVTFKRDTLQGRKSWTSEREARLDAFRWLTHYNYPSPSLPPRTTQPHRLRIQQPPQHQLR